MKHSMDPDQQRTTPQMRRAAQHPGHAGSSNGKITVAAPSFSG
jgi:hypothetical protein